MSEEQCEDCERLPRQRDLPASPTQWRNWQVLALFYMYILYICKYMVSPLLPNFKGQKMIPPHQLRHCALVVTSPPASVLLEFRLSSLSSLSSQLSEQHLEYFTWLWPRREEGGGRGEKRDHFYFSIQNWPTCFGQVGRIVGPCLIKTVHCWKVPDKKLQKFS